MPMEEIAMVYSEYVYQICLIKITLFSDVDECSLSTDECERTCENTVGSYVCSCGEGHELNTDGRTCTGVYVSLVTQISPRKCL